MWKRKVDMEQLVISWGGRMSFDEGEQAEEVLDRVMEHLLEADELTDPTIEFDASTGRITFETILIGLDVLKAVATAAVAFRSALHAAGVNTEDWVHPAKRIVAAGPDVAGVALDGPSVKPLVDA
jgi:hypothetical protein